MEREVIKEKIEKMFESDSELKMLPREFKEILIDDLTTSFLNRVKVLEKYF